MKKFRLMILFLVASILVFAESAAFASSYNTRMKKGFPVPISYVRQKNKRLLAGYGSPIQVDYNYSGSLVTGNTVTFTANAAGGDGDYLYTFELMVEDRLIDYSYYSVYIIEEDFRSSNNSWCSAVYSR